MTRRRTRSDRGLPVAGVVALAARRPLHRVARGGVHCRPGHHQLRVARDDPHPQHLRKVRHRRRRRVVKGVVKGVPVTSVRGRPVVGAGPGRAHLHRVFGAVGEAGNRVTRGRPRRDRGLPVAGVVALAARRPLHRVARGVVHCRPGHHQLRVARDDPHPHHLRGVVVVHRHRHAGDRDAAVAAVRARRAVGQRDRIVRGVRIVVRGHRHRLGRFPVRHREGQGGRVRGHVRAHVPGHRHHDIRRRLGIQHHRVAVPGRVLLRHRQRRRRHRDARCGRGRRRPRHLVRGRAVVGAGPGRAHLHRVFGAVGEARDRVTRGRTPK